MNKYLALCFFILLMCVSANSSYAQNNPYALYISKINLSVPVQTAPLINGQWLINEEKTAFYGEKSSFPGSFGTTVVFAHAKEGLFAHLPLLKKKDTITIATKTSLFVYKITDQKLITPSDISFIQTEGENILAIFTCFGKNDTKRIVYFADLVQTAPFPKLNLVIYEQ